MKYIPSIAFEEMSGSAKGVTAAKVRGRKYIRNRGYGGGIRTTAQAAVKSIFKQLSQNWKNLTNAQILAWNALAQTQAGKSVLGTAAKISGANLYSRLNFWIVKCGGVALSTPPTLVGVEAPEEAEFDLSADAFTFQLTGIPASTENLKLIILASAPQSNGVTRAYGKAVQIGEPRDIVDTAIDIKTDYETVHGAVTEAAPKVFLKYFFVNTATGEKSGEMLGTIRLG
ncbi:MAG: hypothetical protein IJZ70_03850 [Bacteroidales bacterium]|nr:hypothetical protein [Bacteroidales bacterium]MBQ8811426.1 hypothetical protein [Bacteroidales bacterium]